jgi:hypothetical protein
MDDHFFTPKCQRLAVLDATPMKGGTSDLAQLLGESNATKTRHRIGCPSYVYQTPLMPSFLNMNGLWVDLFPFAHIVNLGWYCS